MKTYTKEQFLAAAEKGEVSMIDARHIVSLLDETPDTKMSKQIDADKLLEYLKIAFAHQAIIEGLPIKAEHTNKFSEIALRLFKESQSQEQPEGEVIINDFMKKMQDANERGMNDFGIASECFYLAQSMVAKAVAEKDDLINYWTDMYFNRDNQPKP